MQNWKMAGIEVREIATRFDNSNRDIKRTKVHIPTWKLPQPEMKIEKQIAKGHWVD
ncbi:MAG TPA: hypothetical protein VKZ54_13775 [Membranihabitans sp.]|nr:hypothetical protein [Membranihabitans sp.]